MILTGIGLAAGSGLNAYLPLLVLALADRFTNIIDLGAPFDTLSSFWGLLVLLLILPLELIPDKIPKFDHLSDLFHSAVRPALAAFAFMAVSSQVDDFQMALAFIFGLVIAGAITWVKIAARPGITEMTSGIGNPIVSLLEDGLAIVFAIVAMFLPLGIIAVVPLGLLLLFRTYRRMQTGESRIISAFRPGAPSASRNS